MTMRDFEKDRRTIQDRKDGYVTNEVFLKYADEGWPAALDEIENLKRQLEMAAEIFGGCPYVLKEDDCRNCGGSVDEVAKKGVACWLEYWRQKSGTFQNGNNHGTTSKTETVGEGAE